MSEVIDPPEYYFTGINFNPAFYVQDSGTGITEAEANALYLRKTVADTATAQETFSLGIFTPSITSTGALDIVMPNALSTDILNVGVVSRTISGQVHHYSDGDNCVAGAGVHLNNGINNASATNVMNGTSTTGQVNLMTGATSSGQVNILTGLNSTGNITMGGGSTNNTLTGLTNAINGPTTILGISKINETGGLATTIGTVNVGATIVRGLTATMSGTTNAISGTTNNITGTTNINTTGTSNTNIGVAGSTIAILGTTNINTTGTANTSIGASGQTTTIVGTTDINGTGGLATTIGTVATGTQTIRGATVTISGTTNTITGTTNINTTSSSNTTIGNSTGTLTLNGTTKTDTIEGIATTGEQSFFTTKTIGNLNVFASSGSTAVLNVKGSGIKFDASSTDNPTGVSSLYSNKTGGTLNIANLQTSGGITVGGVGSTTTIKGTGQVDTGLTVTGTGIKTNTIEPTSSGSALTIGNTTTAGVNLGTGALSASGFVSIASSGSNNVTSYMNLGSDSLGTTYFRSRSIDINTNGAGSTNIGTATHLTSINGKTNCNLSDVGILNIKSLEAGQAQILCQPFADTDTIVYFRDAGRTTIRGTIQGVSASTVAYNTTSDRRLKKDIKPMKSMLDTIMLMKPCEYGWVSCDDTSYGFIAQEVHKLFPEMRYGANGCEDIENPCNCETGEPVYYGLDYGKFTPYIVKAFQELKEDYDAKLSKLEARLLALEPKPLTVSPVNDDIIKDVLLHVEATEPHETVIV